jgi:hypothetical protein
MTVTKTSFDEFSQMKPRAILAALPAAILLSLPLIFFVVPYMLGVMSGGHVPQWKVLTWLQHLSLGLVLLACLAGLAVAATETSYIAEVTTTTVGGKVTKVTKTPGVVTSGDIAVISADLSTKGDTEVTVLFTSTKLLGIDHASAGSDQIGLPRTKTFKENLTVDMKPGQTKILSLDDFGMNHGTITLNMVGA